jgi:glucuronate isomerase
LFDVRRTLGQADLVRLRSGVLQWVAREYAQRNWTLQLHLGAQRRTSTRLRKLAGPAGGYATIGNPVHIPSLCTLLDDLERTGGLPRVILYPLNPSDAAALATLTGSFAEDGVAGKIQLGPAWWYNDHDLGIRQYLDVLSRYGLLSVSIGMTTDSRSLLSMTRHEYFRRIFCDWIGRHVVDGLMPDDPALLDGLVRSVCHDNAARLLSLENSDE